MSISAARTGAVIRKELTEFRPSRFIMSTMGGWDRRLWAQPPCTSRRDIPSGSGHRDLPSGRHEAHSGTWCPRRPAGAVGQPAEP